MNNEDLTRFNDIEELEKYFKSNMEFIAKLLTKIDRLNYSLKQSNKEIESLQQEIKELNDSVIWWTNRFNALQRDYEKWKWQKELLIKRDKEQQQKIEDLKEQLEYQDLWRQEYLSRIDKAIEYLINNAIFDLNDKGVNKTMLSILRGSDKE